MQEVRPKPIGATKAAVSRFAEDVARRVAYRPGESMRGLVLRLGGHLSFNEKVRPGELYPESIVVQPTGEFQIFLPTVTTAERDRFTVAHELGHYFLHFPKAKSESPGARMVAFRKVRQDDEIQKRAEWEANWFAAAFLMPEDEFRQKYSTNGKAFCINHFGVSQSAVEVRASTLSLG